MSKPTKLYAYRNKPGNRWHLIDPDQLEAPGRNVTICGRETDPAGETLVINQPAEVPFDMCNRCHDEAIRRSYDAYEQLVLSALLVPKSRFLNVTQWTPGNVFLTRPGVSNAGPILVSNLGDSGHGVASFLVQGKEGYVELTMLHNGRLRLQVNTGDDEATIQHFEVTL